MTFLENGFCYSKRGECEGQWACTQSQQNLKSLCSLIAIVKTSAMMMAGTALVCDIYRLGPGTRLPCPLKWLYAALERRGAQPSSRGGFTWISIDVLFFLSKCIDGSKCWSRLKGDSRLLALHYHKDPLNTISVALALQHSGQLLKWQFKQIFLCRQWSQRHWGSDFFHFPLIRVWPLKLKSEYLILKTLFCAQTLMSTAYIMLSNLESYF